MGALGPLRDSPGQRVSDAESDDLVLAFARAYTLSEIFPVRHATVQEAIAELCAKAVASLDMEISSAGIRTWGRVVGDRHGYLRELSRDLRQVGVTAVRVAPDVEADEVERFLEVLRQVHSPEGGSFERGWQEAETPRIQVAFDGTSLPVLQDAWEPVDQRWPSPPVDLMTPELEQTLEDLHLHGEEILQVPNGLAPADGAAEEGAEVDAVSAPGAADPFALPLTPTDAAEQALLTPVDVRLDGELESEPPAADEAEWRDAFGLPETAPLDGAFTEDEWEVTDCLRDGITDLEAPILDSATEPEDLQWEEPVGVDALAPTDDPFRESVSFEPDNDSSSEEWPGPDGWEGESDPMPWQDVGGFWREDDDHTDEAVADDAGPEPAAPGSGDGGLLEGVVEEASWSLMEAGDLAAEPAAFAGAAAESTSVTPEEAAPPAEDEIQSAAEPAELGLPVPDGLDAARLAQDPYAAPVIRSEDDLALIAAFRRALSDGGDGRAGGSTAWEDPLVESQPGVDPTRIADLAPAEGAQPVIPIASLAPDANVAPEVAVPDQSFVETPPFAGGPHLDPDIGEALVLEPPSTVVAPDGLAAEPHWDVVETLPSLAGSAMDDTPPFASVSYETIAELAIAYLSAPDGRRPAVRSAVLERADNLATEGEHDSVCDAVDALLLGSADGRDGAYALARSLARPPVISVLVRRLGDAKEASERERALRIVGRIPDLVAPALASELSEVPPRAARRNFLDALFGMGEHAFNESLPMLEDSRWFIVRNGVDILGEVAGAGAVDRVTPSLSHPDARVRRATVMAMAKIGGEEAGGRLLATLEDPDAQVREAAAMALGHLRMPRALRPLLLLLESEKSDDFQMIILRSLGQLADPSAVPAIEKRALGSFFYRPSTAVRIAAYRALGSMGTPHATELVRQAVEDKNPEIAAAARALAARF